MISAQALERSTIWAVLGVGGAAIVTVGGIILWILSRDAGTQRMREIAASIRSGAVTFLLSEYKILSLVMLLIGSLLAWQVSLLGGLCFLGGATCSVLAGAVGMGVATAANVRTAQAARRGTSRALAVALAGGAVMGLCVSTFGLLGVSLAYVAFHDVTIVSCFAMGASLAALFARVGGGIYTKAADIGADLVGKIEAHIPEDDPRNPGVIADNVGDNVGDVAGMGADLFESYVGALFSAVALGIMEFESGGLHHACFPILLMCAGLLGSLLTLAVMACWARLRPKASPRALLAAGIWISGALGSTMAILLAQAVFGSPTLGLVVLAGAVAGVVTGKATEFYTSGRCVQRIAHASLGGPAMNVISGISVGLASTAAPVIMISVATIFAHELAGLYGIALAGVGMLFTLGITLSVDAYGPIADNAGGIAQMADLPTEVRRITDQLDSVGNTTAAIGKGFAIGSAALTALALFASFSVRVNLKQVNLSKPSVYVGVLIGAMLPFLFSSLVIRAVGGAANRMVDEIRRQFKEIVGLMQGRAAPDYENCVRIATRGALRGMFPPALLGATSPLIIYALLGIEAVGGLLAGVTMTGVILAIFMANTGGAWDNAKKFVEEDNLGGKGSLAHQATVVGDTVGDPLKDTAGPSINILIKVIAIVSMVVIPLVYHRPAS